MASQKTVNLARCLRSGEVQENKQLAGQLTYKNTEKSSPAQGPSQRVLAEIPRGRDIIRVTLRNIEGETFIDIRRCRPFGAVYRDTPFGISLRVEAALIVARAILKALGVEVSA